MQGAISYRLTNLPIHGVLRKGNAEAGELPAVLGCGEAIANMRLHDLRHSYATILLLDGIPPTQVPANLGHKDASITLRVYSQVLPQSQQAAADLITKAFSAV